MAAVSTCHCKLLQLARTSQRKTHLCIQYRTAMFDRLLGRKEDKQAPVEDDLPKAPVILERFQTLKKRTSIQTVKGYKPRHDVEDRIKSVVFESYGESPDWRDINLDNRRQKFKLLTRLIKEFDHDVTNMDLNSIEKVSDVVDYFKTEIRDTCAYEDLSKLDLPKNLHINKEYIRFNPETDTIFDGKTAFPGSKTIVSSIKYRRKYKGH